MIDFRRGRIAYAVLSFGGFAGLADKLFAIPWSGLRINASEGYLILDVPRDRLKDAPGFDKCGRTWPTSGGEARYTSASASGRRGSCGPEPLPNIRAPSPTA